MSTLKSVPSVVTVPRSAFETWRSPRTRSVRVSSPRLWGYCGGRLTARDNYCTALYSTEPYVVTVHCAEGEFSNKHRVEGLNTRYPRQVDLLFKKRLLPFPLACSKLLTPTMYST